MMKRHKYPWMKVRCWVFVEHKHLLTNELIRRSLVKKRPVNKLVPATSRLQLVTWVGSYLVYSHSWNLRSCMGRTFRLQGFNLLAWGLLMSLKDVRKEREGVFVICHFTTAEIVISCTLKYALSSNTSCLFRVVPFPSLRKWGGWSG